MTTSPWRIMAPSLEHQIMVPTKTRGSLNAIQRVLLLRKYNRCPCKPQVRLAKNHSQVFKTLSIRVNT